VVFARAALGEMAGFGVGWISYVSALASAAAVMAGLTAASGPAVGIDTPGELRLAASATAAAHAAGMTATRPGVMAAEVRAAMEAALMARGMGCAYPSIVTPHGEILHSERYDERLADGDLLLADVGAETPAGWAGDVTRTWPASGRYSTTQRELYEVVLSAQKQAIAAVTPGSRYRDVHVLACQALAAGLVDLGILRGDPIELDVAAFDIQRHQPAEIRGKITHEPRQCREEMVDPRHAGPRDRLAHLDDAGRHAIERDVGARAIFAFAQPSAQLVAGQHHVGNAGHHPIEQFNRQADSPHLGAHGRRPRCRP